MNKRVWLSVVALAIGVGLLVSAGFASPASSNSSKQRAHGAKGGTMRVDLTSDFDFIDPALAYFSHSWALEFQTSCKLLSFPDKEASQGGTKIVPEVATSLPAVSGNGKVYTFTLRNTFKFADGTPVTAASFAYGMNRDLQPKMSSPASSFMGDIKGAQAVIDGKATSASGIKAKGNKLVITLTKVAPDFLARITMPFFSAVKTDTPMNPDGVSAPSKGTACGRYYVSNWVTKRTATLSRNPFYKGGRPANPDQIVYNIGIPSSAEELRVINGETDFGGFPTADAANLYNQYYVALGKKNNTTKPSFVIRRGARFWYLNMNQDEPLFKNNPKLNQAVNWAIDRPQMVRQHGAKAGVVTSQILPYDFPGHNPKAVYPVVASKSPNFNKAKALATSSVLRGGNCRFWTFNTTFGPAVAQVVQYDLKQIGLNCAITPLDRVVETTKGGNRSTNDYDLLLNGWGQDYPDPYDFINILLDGSQLLPDNNINLSYFNSPRWNARMHAAAKLSGAARYKAYAKLDHDLMAGPAPVAPYIDTNDRIFMSKHVGCYVYNQTYGNDYGASCVQ